MIRHASTTRRSIVRLAVAAVSAAAVATGLVTAGSAAAADDWPAWQRLGASCQQSGSHGGLEMLSVDQDLGFGAQVGERVVAYGWAQVFRDGVYGAWKRSSNTLDYTVMTNGAGS